jgi:predicted O-linked N-acetylglucosamine transferase (SPINDLY family)
LGRLNDAEASYRRVLEIDAGIADAHYNLANTLRDMDRFDEAEASYRRALQIKPDYVQGHSNLGILLHDRGRLDAAEASYRRALQIKPDYAQAHSNLGRTLHDMGRLVEAEASYRRALQIKPDYAEVHSNLGNTLHDLGRLDEAEASYRQALQIKPDYAEAHSNLGSTLHDLGRLTEAEASWRQALKFKPNYAMAHSNLLFCLSQIGTVDAQTLFAEHCRFGEQFETPYRANFLQHSNLCNPDRCLQIGFVSGDLRNHAVSNFIEPMAEHLSGYSQLSLHAYSNHVIDDNATQRIRGYFAHWHRIVGLSDAALADKIRANGIDILIDLSGHTAKNRLLTFARKPAPIQISWVGYPCTTGLRAMDYFLADRFLLPPGQFEDQFTEKIVRLPSTGPFLPYKDAPQVSPLPALSNGHVTFGSFNRLSKLSREVIALWSQLLRALPDSRMVLGGMPEEGKYDVLIDWFAQENIARERLDFYPRSDMPGYLKLHQRVDICLDTFPYTGGTTTHHAIWMGVPTLSLAGKTAAGRPGAAILGNAGLEAFVANDATDFVQKGLSWAGKLTELSDLRAGMRERFANSAAGQPQLIAASLERALRIMWQRWCAGLSADSFEVTRQEIEDAKTGADK